MKRIFTFSLFVFALNIFSQTGKITEDFLQTIEKDGLTFYKFKKEVKKKKHLPVNFLPKQKEIVYDGKNVQLLLLGRTLVTYAPNSGYNGMTHTDHISMLFAKKINEDYFTYIGYYPDKRDQISVTPFKKHGAQYLKDFPELSEKVAKKQKGYKRFNAVAVFEEYDNWLTAKKG